MLVRSPINQVDVYKGHSGDFHAADWIVDRATKSNPNSDLAEQLRQSRQERIDIDNAINANIESMRRYPRNEDERQRIDDLDRQIQINKTFNGVSTALETIGLAIDLWQIGKLIPRIIPRVIPKTNRQPFNPNAFPTNLNPRNITNTSLPASGGSTLNRRQPRWETFDITDYQRQLKPSTSKPWNC